MLLPQSLAANGDASQVGLLKGNSSSQSDTAPEKPERGQSDTAPEKPERGKDMKRSGSGAALVSLHHHNRTKPREKEKKKIN
jgi:hypothetical protein